MKILKKIWSVILNLFQDLVKLRNRARSTSQGISLIITILFVSAFLLVIGGITEVQVKVGEVMRDRKSEMRVTDLADAAKEVGSFWAARHREGQNLSESTTASEDAARVLGLVASEHGSSSCATDGSPGACAGVAVYGRTPDAGDDVKLQMPLPGGGLPSEGTNEYFSVPAVIRDSEGAAIGTGDASEACTDVQNADDPCNWNRLYVGETVEIPLYYLDSNGLVVPFDWTDGGSDFKLRVRTPCRTVEGEIDPDDNCEAGERFTLYPAETDVAYRNIAQDPVLVQWSIFDAEGTNVMSTRGRKDQADSSFRYLDLDQNTEVSSGRINEAKNTGDQLSDFIVLQDDLLIPSNRHDGLIIDTQSPEDVADFIDSLVRPVLRLTLVAHPQRILDGTTTGSQNLDNTSLDLSFLEYQVLSRSDLLSDGKSNLYGFAQIGRFMKEFSSGKSHPASAAGFAIEN